MYVIDYFSDEVQQTIFEWPLGLRARYFYLTELMRTRGSNLGSPHTEALRDGLFEIRVKGKEGIGRAFYCTLVGQRIVVLHSIIKKSQKTPKKDLDLALARMKEIKNENAA
ncbi:MAG: type II toxin-antitoxin system RelE/ParE family toxin [Sutterellaceae bacterium]|nr:type II toxin-antitoxin system RelE/ParE family toxin [Sutterellaceae bacterium]